MHGGAICNNFPFWSWIGASLDSPETLCLPHTALFGGNCNLTPDFGSTAFATGCITSGANPAESRNGKRIHQHAGRQMDGRGLHSVADFRLAMLVSKLLDFSSFSSLVCVFSEKSMARIMASLFFFQTRHASSKI